MSPARAGADHGHEYSARDALSSEPGSVVTASSRVGLPAGGPGQPDQVSELSGGSQPAVGAPIAGEPAADEFGAGEPGAAPTGTGRTGGSQPGTNPPGGHRASSRLAMLGRPKLVQAGLVTLGIVVLFFSYLAQARTTPQISEGASQALQAWDMLHGNLLLHGWSLSDVSFWTTELPEYMLVEALRGLNAYTVPIAAGISYFGQVVLAGFLAKGRATGSEAWVRILIAVGIMLAPPVGAATTLLMASPDHVGTHVPLLLIFLVLDRVRPRWWLPIVITVMLTWAQVADTLVLVEGAGPIAAVCLLRMYRRRGPWRGQVYDASLVIGAGLSAILAKAILHAVQAVGGFYVRAPVASFGTSGQISQYFWVKLEDVLLVFGANFFDKVFGIGVIPTLLHLVGLGLVVWALVHVIRRFYVEDDQIAQILVLGFIAVLAAFQFGTKPDSNEIVGLLPLGAVLAGRALGGKVLKSGMVPALGVVFAVFAGSLLVNAVHPPVVNENTPVAAWLKQHHLTYGLGGYWNASSITAETGGAVQVRPVRTYQNTVVSTNFETSSIWYDPRRHYANFVVRAQLSCGAVCLTHEGLEGAFGIPAQTYYVGNYIVYVYHKNLLPYVHEVTFCGSSWPWMAKGVPTTNLECKS
jgi:hypothetical protein